MDVREKLIEILRKPMFPHELVDPTEAVADYLLDSGVTVQEWMSVKEPPKERGEYLCYFKYEPESPDVICENTYYGSGRWMSETGRVTHWQYLPQPPKGE